MDALWNVIADHPALQAFLSAVLVASVVARLWRKQVRPMLRAIVRMDDAIPVLLGIADQFRPNAGHSLHDRLTRIEGQVSSCVEVVESIESQVDAQERMQMRTFVAIAEGFRLLGHELAVQLPSWDAERDPDRRKGT